MSEVWYNTHEVDYIDLHVMVVPVHAWRRDLNYAYLFSCHESRSLGVVRVDARITLYDLREVIARQLDTSRILPVGFVYLFNTGRCLSKISCKQELKLTVSFYSKKSDLSAGILCEVFIIDSRCFTTTSYDSVLPPLVGVASYSPCSSISVTSPNYLGDRIDGYLSSSPSPSPPIEYKINYGDEFRGLPDDYSNVGPHQRSVVANGRHQYDRDGFNSKECGNGQRMLPKLPLHSKVQPEVGSGLRVPKVRSRFHSECHLPRSQITRQSYPGHARTRHSTTKSLPYQVQPGAHSQFNQLGDQQAHSNSRTQEQFHYNTPIQCQPSEVHHTLNNQVRSHSDYHPHSKMQHENQSTCQPKFQPEAHSNNHQEQYQSQDNSNLHSSFNPAAEAHSDSSNPSQLHCISDFDHPNPQSHVKPHSHTTSLDQRQNPVDSYSPPKSDPHSHTLLPQSHSIPEHHQYQYQSQISNSFPQSGSEDQSHSHSENKPQSYFDDQHHSYTVNKPHSYSEEQPHSYSEYQTHSNSKNHSQPPNQSEFHPELQSHSNSRPPFQTKSHSQSPSRSESPSHNDDKQSLSPPIIKVDLNLNTPSVLSTTSNLKKSLFGDDANGDGMGSLDGTTGGDESLYVSDGKDEVIQPVTNNNSNSNDRVQRLTVSHIDKDTMERPFKDKQQTQQIQQQVQQHTQQVQEQVQQIQEQVRQPMQQIKQTQEHQVQKQTQQQVQQQEQQQTQQVQQQIKQTQQQQIQKQTQQQTQEQVQQQTQQVQQQSNLQEGDSEKAQFVSIDNFNEQTVTKLLLEDYTSHNEKEKSSKDIKTEIEKLKEECRLLLERKTVISQQQRRSHLLLKAGRQKVDDKWKKRYYHEKSLTTQLEDKIKATRKTINFILTTSGTNAKGSRHNYSGLYSEIANVKNQCVKLEKDIIELQKRLKKTQRRLSVESKTTANLTSQVKLTRKQLIEKNIELGRSTAMANKINN